MTEQKNGDSEQDLSNTSESSLPEFVPPLNSAAADVDENANLPEDVDVADLVSAEGSVTEASQPEWILELQQALDEQCGLYDIVRVADGKIFPEALRPRAWQACLDIPWNTDDASGGLAAWDGMFNLESQSVLHAECEKLAESVEAANPSEKLMICSDAESVITAFCCSQKSDFNPDGGWIAMLRVLLRLRLPTSLLYELFAAVIHRFIPKGDEKNDVIHHLFRLILLYHDPELCNFLDSKKISFDAFSSTWFSTLLAGNCKTETIYAVWDIYFQNNDPFLVLFLGLILLFSAKEEIMGMKDKTRDEMIGFLRGIPAGMEVEDVSDFFELANANLGASPKSLRETNWTSLFGTRPVSPSKRLHIPIQQSLCLPVTIDEVISAATRHTGCRFFVIDCRPPEQYNSSHLITAFHLDANLLIQDAAAFDAAVDRLLASQKQAIESNSIAGGEHLCFMGSGFEAEDQFVHMVIARMLQKHHKFVSMADGGFEALLYYMQINSMEIERVLVGTELQKMVRLAQRRSSSTSASKPATPSSEGSSFFGKLKNAVLPKVTDVREKLATYITNPQASASVVRHVSAGDRPKKVHYRPVIQNVFVFDDAEDDGEFQQDYAEGELQNWRDFVRRPDVLAHFECQEYISNEQMVSSHLVISETDIYNFRPSADNPELASLASQHNLMEVLKIVCRRKIPELITIKYGSLEDGNVLVHDVEKYYIAKSGDAIKAIKMQILKLMEENDGRAWDDKD